MKGNLKRNMINSRNPTHITTTGWVDLIKTKHTIVSNVEGNMALMGNMHGNNAMEKKFSFHIHFFCSKSKLERSSDDLSFPGQAFIDLAN